MGRSKPKQLPHTYFSGQIIRVSTNFLHLGASYLTVYGVYGDKRGKQLHKLEKLMGMSRYFRNMSDEEKAGRVVVLIGKLTERQLEEIEEAVEKAIQEGSWSKWKCTQELVALNYSGLDKEALRLLSGRRCTPVLELEIE